MTEASMLDTNVFSAVLNGKLPLASLAGRKVLVTGIQTDECRATPNEARRTALLKIIEEIAPELCLASSLCFDIEGAGFNQATWNDGTGNFQKMLERLKALDKKPKSKAQHLNQLRDVLIAETAIKHGATLVTDDCKLAVVVLEFGGRVMTSAQFGRLPRTWNDTLAEPRAR